MKDVRQFLGPYHLSTVERTLLLHCIATYAREFEKYSKEPPEIATEDDKALFERTKSMDEHKKIISGLFLKFKKDSGLAS